MKITLRSAGKGIRTALMALAAALAGCGGGRSDPTGLSDPGTRAPATRSNGEALSMSEMARYTRYCGDAVGPYPGRVVIEGAFTTSAAVTGLPAGRYGFVLTTADSAGQESTHSDAARKLTG